MQSEPAVSGLSPAHLFQSGLLLGRVQVAYLPWDIPEADVQELWLNGFIVLCVLPAHLLDHQLVPLGVAESLSEIGGQVHEVVDLATVALHALNRSFPPRLFRGYLALPHEPQLEDVVVSPALDGLIPGVEAHIVRLVLHEEVVGRHLVALEEEPLKDGLVSVGCPVPRLS